MAENSNEDVLARFLQLETGKDLVEFASSLDPANPYHRAFGYYISTWNLAQDYTAFEPVKYVAEDGSAILYGNCPVVFGGSNCWAEKCYAELADYEAKLEQLYKRCASIRKGSPSAKICLLMVPEKDFVISVILLKEDRFSKMLQAIVAFRNRLRGIGIELVFEDAVVGMDKYQTVADFEYFDSHLAPRNYVILFSRALEVMGFDWAKVRPRVGMVKMNVYFDLQTKFGDTKVRPLNVYDIDFKDEAIRQVAGSPTFAEPLGDTSQTFRNDAAIFDENVLVLGDSHSSILEKRRLTYLFAGTFRSVHFDWNPAGVRGVVDTSAYDTILLEISSRFVL